MSETTNLKLFKHDNPSTNTNPFNVEQSLNENWDKIDTAVTKNSTDIANVKLQVSKLEKNTETLQTSIGDIKDEQSTQNKDISDLQKSEELQNEKIIELQKENIMLKGQIPTGHVEGQDISLSDSAKMPLIEFSVKGNSRQSTEPTIETPIEVEAIENNVKLIKSNKNLLEFSSYDEEATYNISIQKPFYKLTSSSEYSTVYDKFIKIENKWYEQHNMQKIELSDFDWERGAVLSGTGVNTLRWNTTIQIPNLTITSSDKGSLSNYFKNLAGQLYDTDKSCFRIEGYRICVRLPKTIATNVTQVKEYFKTLKEQEKSVYVIATLATPELIECTQEQTQVLEQILQDGTYKGITHYYTTNNLKATIELTYYKDLEAIVNNIQSTLLNEVGGN